MRRLLTGAMRLKHRLAGRLATSPVFSASSVTSKPQVARHPFAYCRHALPLSCCMELLGAHSTGVGHHPPRRRPNQQLCQVYQMRPCHHMCLSGHVVMADPLLHLVLIPCIRRGLATPPSSNMHMLRTRAKRTAFWSVLAQPNAQE